MRTYESDDRRVYPSVTTICRWAKLSPPVHFVSEERLEWLATRGTFMHDYVARVLQHLDPMVIPKEFSLHAVSFDEWNRVMDPKPVLVERKVYHHGLRYAGTLDLLCWIQDGSHNYSLKLIDFKTRRGNKADGYQLAGYTMAVENMIENGRIEIRRPDTDTVLTPTEFRVAVERVVVGLKDTGRIAEHHHCKGVDDFLRFRQAVTDFHAKGAMYELWDMDAEDSA